MWEVSKQRTSCYYSNTKHTMEHGAAGIGYRLHTLNKILTPRQLLGVGIWPGRTTGLNLKSKYGRYKGNQDLYHKDVAAKRSYYTEASADRAPETASKSAMVEKTYGKYQPNPILGKKRHGEYHAT